MRNVYAPKFGLKIRAEKEHFGVPELKFLGPIISEHGIRPDEEIVVMVVCWLLSNRIKLS